MEKENLHMRYLVSVALRRAGKLLAIMARIFQALAILCSVFADRLRTTGWRSSWCYLVWRLNEWHVRRRNSSQRAIRVECPCCGWTGYDFLMLDCGTFLVPCVICPQCGGHERHRLLHLYLQRCEPGFFNRSGTVLHFAPEPHVRRLVDVGNRLRCFSTDYAWHAIKDHPGHAFQADMQRLPIRDASFDIVFCLHVLEHVPDDRRGIAELYRILKPDGDAIIMVPFMMEWEKTVEFDAPDPVIWDHVRGYAPHDFSDRLSPFRFTEIKAPDFLSTDEIRRFRIPPDSQVIFRCRKT